MPGGFIRLGRLMTEIDDLAADQRAVLQLLLKQGQTYEDLSGLLKIDAAAVRARAHAALDALGPDAGRRLAPERRAEVSDYLLGQQSAAAREATRDHLAASAAARAWARVVASALRPLATEPLPEIPDEVAGAAVAEEEARASASEPGAAPEPVRGVVGTPRSSRLGGALLLGRDGVLVLVVVIILITSGGGGGSKK